MKQEVLIPEFGCMEIPAKPWYLENFNLGEVLSLDEKKRIAAAADKKCMARKEVIFLPVDVSGCIYFLRKGKVKIYRCAPDGRETILSIIRPGEIFGELAMAGQQAREETAEVLEDALVYTISLKEMRQLMKSIPALNYEVIKFLGSRVKKVQSRLESLISKSSEERIRSLIRDIAREHGRIISGEPEQLEVKLGLTQSEIARLTATCRQSVNRVLNRLERQQVIKFDRRRIYVVDISKL